MTRTEYWDEIARLADEANRAREAFSPPEEPPDRERAMEFLREGVGPAVMVYVDARTGEWVRFSDIEHSLLERAMNDYLTLYARCFGEQIDAEFSVREAAELLVETHNILDVAQLLTHVPERSSREAGDRPAWQPRE